MQNLVFVKKNALTRISGAWLQDYKISKDSVTHFHVYFQLQEPIYLVDGNVPKIRPENNIQIIIDKTPYHYIKLQLIYLELAMVFHVWMWMVHYSTRPT